jgi:hypothetical protein
MDMNRLFELGNGFALAGWILLLAAPGWRWTERLVLSGFWSLALSAVYVVLALVELPRAEGGFDSLQQVRTLFASDPILLAGWVHYLAFDLFVGAVEIRLARAHQIPHLYMIPILLATFMLGPVGLMLFFLVKSAREKRIAAVIPGRVDVSA